jgi:geranylgeranyl reductase family protein
VPDKGNQIANLVPVATDVLIIGAGPAGSAAAITAVRQGLKVVVIDKASFPRDKCCGDGLTTLALRQLESLGFESRHIPSWQDIDGAWVRSPSGREVLLPLPDHGHYAAVAPRLELDNTLVAMARERGAQVLERCAFSEISVETHQVVVDVEFLDTAQHQQITAQWVIAADGMWSPVRKALGFADTNYRGEWHAFRQYASQVTGPAQNRLIVWFEPDLLPGYAWSFPLPNQRVNIGFGIVRDGERKIQDMAALWRDLLERPHIRAALGPDVQMEGRHTAWPIPANVDKSVTGSGRVLFTGDAVAACDYLTGEGIGQALLTGELAIEAIIKGGTTREIRHRYRRDVEHHLRADHRMSLALSRVLAHERGARGVISLLDHAGPWARRHFARWMFEDEPRAIAVSPQRWHRQLFRRPGAWASRP